jgi:MFS superfamily sulfate permease-like transporter
MEIIINLLNGKPLKSIFKAPTEVSFTDNEYLVEISDAAVFSNFLGIKRKLEAIPPSFNVTIDLSKTHLVDHSVMENFEHFKHEYEQQGGKVKIIGLDNHSAVSEHITAGRKKKKFR